MMSIAGVSENREEEYELVRPIGSGSFGQVFLVVHRVEQRQYVMKKIAMMATMDANKRQATELEVRLLSELRHPNIVAYRDSFADREGCLCILMEYCEHGDIHTFIQHAKQNGGMPDEHKLIEWFIQVALALHALHLKKILHRDLKTQNIFLTGCRERNIFALKLGDFGIAKVLDSTTDLAKTQIGTPFYMSPELINNKPYSYKSDVWGLGCVLYEIVNGQRAFDAQSLNGLALKIIKSHYTPITTQCSQGTKSLIKSMLSKNATHRPNIKEILHMPAIRRQIPPTLSTVIEASAVETRIVTERTLVEQLTTLGLGGLINCPGPRRDRRRLQQRLEKAELRKRREEEMLQKTAALLEQCLREPGPSTRQRRSKSPPRHMPQGLEVADVSLYGAPGPQPAAMSRMDEFSHPEYQAWQQPAQNWPESQRPPPWDPEPHHHDSQEETLLPAMSHRERLREDPISHSRSVGDGGWHPDHALPSRPRARTEDASGPLPPDLSLQPSSVSWLLDYDHIKKENLANPFANCRPKVVHSPRRRQKGDRGPSPPPLQYGEPVPPHNGPPSGMWTSWRTGDVPHGPPPPPRPSRSVRLESLDADGRSQPPSEESDTSESVSEVEDCFSDGTSTYSDWHGDDLSRRRSAALQQRIEQCRAAIYRHRMKIEMLQYSAMEQNEVEHVDDRLPGGEWTERTARGPDAHPHALGVHAPVAPPGPEVGGISRRGFGAPGGGGPAPAIVQDLLARLARRCLEGLGGERFQAARRCLQVSLDAAEVPSTVRQRMLELLGVDKIGFFSLIDQIVHMERRWGVIEGGPT